MAIGRQVGKWHINATEGLPKPSVMYTWKPSVAKPLREQCVGGLKTRASSMPVKPTMQNGTFRYKMEQSMYNPRSARDAKRPQIPAQRR